jgi:hypothetical protein
VQLATVVVLVVVGVSLALEGSIELVPDEVGLEDDKDIGNGHQREVKTINNGVGKDLSQVARVQGVGRQDLVDRQGGDGTIVQEPNDQRHKQREVKLVDKGKDGKAHNNADSHSTGVDGVIAHRLEGLE